MARLLLVDDDEVALEMTGALLEAHGHEVVTAVGAGPALAAQPETFDLILTDLNMPGIDGAEFKALLDARGVNVPVIIVSGEAEAARIALQLGAFDSLRKPVVMQNLLSLIELATERTQRRS